MTIVQINNEINDTKSKLADIGVCLSANLADINKCLTLMRAAIDKVAILSEKKDNALRKISRLCSEAAKVYEKTSKTVSEFAYNSQLDEATTHITISALMGVRENYIKKGGDADVEINSLYETLLSLRSDFTNRITEMMNIISQLTN